MLAGGAAVRLARLDHFSYWLDEVMETRFVQGSWSQFWKDLKLDAVHPPLDYLVVRAVERLHPTDAARKLPAVLWGVGTLACFGALLRRRAGETIALAAVVLLAVAPFHVRYSQELRPYSLGLLAICVSLLCLDRFLERPSFLRLAGLYLSSLGTAYTLYLAAVALAIAGAAMVVEDAFSREPGRRRAARQFLAWSPAFVAALWVGYLPWWPVALEALRRPPPFQADPLTLARLDRILSFFAFAWQDRVRLGPSGAAYVLLAAAGLGLCLRKERLRFLAAWGLAGLVAIELLWQLHPHSDSTRRYVPAGIAIPGLAAVALAFAWDRRRSRIVAAAALAAILIFASGALRTYFQKGRPDWRVLARWIRDRSLPGEKIFSENQYTQLCLGFYLSAHDRGSAAPHEPIAVLNLDGEVVRLTWSWQPGSRAWLVLAGGPNFEKLRSWAEPFPAFPVSPAEGAVVRRLEPALRDAAFARVPP